VGVLGANTQKQDKEVDMDIIHHCCYYIYWTLEIFDIIIVAANLSFWTCLTFHMHLTELILASVSSGRS
jgi:hypothetical protein